MNIIFRSFLTLILLVSFAGLHAQGSRIAHLNANDIMEKMDEYKIANMKMDSVKKVYQSSYADMDSEYRKKYEEYAKLASDKATPDLIKETKEKELMAMKERMDEFGQAAQDEMSKQGQVILEPVIKKLKDAIAVVAKEKGYSYVLDNNQTAGSNILYSSDADDISAAVKLKLNIK